MQIIYEFLYHRNVTNIKVCGVCWAGKETFNLAVGEAVQILIKSAGSGAMKVIAALCVLLQSFMVNSRLGLGFVLKKLPKKALHVLCSV